MQPALAELDLRQSSRGAARLLADQHLSAGRRRAESGCDVDGPAIPLALSLHGGACMHAHTHGRECRDGVQFLDQADRQGDAVGGLVAAQGNAVSERLQLLGPVAGQEVAHPLVEAERDLGRPIVALGVGERGEADQVRE
jgi:hypothetical protein